MKKYLFAALFCLSLCCAYCQISEVERYDDLDLLTVAEKKLLPVLDAVLAEERTRNYYRSDTKFSIFFQADSTIQIEAFDLLFSLSETASEDYYGVIEYGGHSFLWLEPILTSGFFTGPGRNGGSGFIRIRHTKRTGRRYFFSFRMTAIRNGSIVTTGTNSGCLILWIPRPTNNTGLAVL